MNDVMCSCCPDPPAEKPPAGHEQWWQADQLSYARSLFAHFTGDVFRFREARDKFGRGLEGALDSHLGEAERSVLRAIEWDEVSV